MDKSVKALVTLVVVGIILGFTFLEKISSPASDVPQVSTNTRKIIESTESAIAGVTGEEVFVVKVVDGDTIELTDGRKVRYIGIDTPETKDPRRPVGCFGKEAARENKSLVEGKFIILEKDVSETDKYDRLLRYVYLTLENGQQLFINDYLVREGFAKASSYPPDVKYNEKFRQAEKYARENNLGLWGNCDTLKKENL